MQSEEQVAFLRQRLLKRKDETQPIPDLEPYQVFLMGFETAITDLENEAETTEVGIAVFEDPENTLGPTVTIIEKEA